MVVNAVEHVGQIGLRVDAVHLGGLDDHHGASQRLRTGLGAREEPVLAADSNRAQGALGCIVVDGDPTILREQAEGAPSAKAISEGFGEIGLAGDTGELLFGPQAEGVCPRPAEPLAHGEALCGRSAGDLALDVVKRANPLERLPCDRRLGRGPDVAEVPPEVSPTGRFSEALRPARTGLIERGIALVGIGLQDAAASPEVMVDVLLAPVRREVVDGAQWREARKGALVPDVGPDPALPHPLPSPRSRIVRSSTRIGVSSAWRRSLPMIAVSIRSTSG